jgi:hypothetical protein
MRPRLRFVDAPIDSRPPQWSAPQDDGLYGQVEAGSGGRSDPNSGLWTTGGQELVQTLPAGNYFLVKLVGGRVQLWRANGADGSMDLGKTTVTSIAAARDRIRANGRVQAARDSIILQRMNKKAAEMWGRK